MKTTIKEKVVGMLQEARPLSRQQQKAIFARRGKQTGSGSVLRTEGQQKRISASVGVGSGGHDKPKKVTIIGPTQTVKFLGQDFHIVKSHDKKDQSYRKAKGIKSGGGLEGKETYHLIRGSDSHHFGRFRNVKRAARMARDMARQGQSPEEKEKRMKQNEKSRSRHWLKTGVSQRTVDWMRSTGQL